MVYRSVIFTLLAVIFGFGCNGNSDKKTITDKPDAAFPRFLVGRWEASNGEWAFTFTEDGKISSARLSMGRNEMQPEQRLEVKLIDNGKGVYEAGQWSVQYDKITRYLYVEIVMDHIRLETGGQILDGSTTDNFIGKVIEDGSEWHAEWFAYPNYVAYINGVAKPLTQDAGDNPVDQLLFTKVEKTKDAEK